MTELDADGRKTDVRVGTVIADRYRIDALIDEGAMGKVYVGEHRLMRKRVAIKLLRRELTMVPEVVARFEREAMAAANIEHHNVAAATDFGKLEDGTVFLVLEFVEGRTLRKEIELGPMEAQRALHIGEQILGALIAAHELGIVHRDLKPDNVMLVEQSGDPDFVKVLDFGIAKVPLGDVGVTSDKPITRAGMIFGTPEYMPPEQALGKDVDVRADLYSLGVVLFELLAGCRPFPDDNDLGVLGLQLSTEPQFAERAPGVKVSAGVERLVMSLLAREPEARPQSAQEAMKGLRALMDSSPAVRVPQTRAPLGSASDLQVPALAPPMRIEMPGAGGLDVPVNAFKTAQGKIRELQLVDRARTAKAYFPAPLNSMPTAAVFAAPVVLLLLLIWALSGSDAEEESELALGSAGLLLASAPAEHMDSTNTAPTRAVPPEKSVHRSRVNEAKRAPSKELRVARAKGGAGLKTLAALYPKDSQVQLELAGALGAAKEHRAAVQAVEAAVKLDPSLESNGTLARAVWFGAQNRAAENASFRLITGALSNRGCEIAFDLATTPKVPARVAARARNYLRARGFQKKGEPHVKVAASLLLAKNCQDRAVLLGDAKKYGSTRALKLLNDFARARGCAKGEANPCNQCLQGNLSFKQAVKTITARTKK